MKQPNKNIKAILFDLDGTLRHHIPTGDKVFVDYLKSKNIHFSWEDETRAERWVHFYFANSFEIQKDKQVFTIDTKAFWVNYSKRRMVALGMDAHQAAELAPEVSAHMGEHYKPEVYVPPDAYKTLDALTRGGYTLGMVSNRDEPYRDELKKLNLDHYFEFAVAGGELQSFKPDSRIFQKGLELAGTAPYETLYVGDNYFADIRGSLRAGLVPVLYDPGALFPDAVNECAVIRSFDELHDVLK